MLIRSRPHVAHMGVHYLLDRCSSPLHPKMVQEPDGGRSATGPGTHVAMPRLQLKVDRRARPLHLLVFQGTEPEVDPGAAASLLWPDLLQTTRNLPTPLPVVVSFRPMSTLHAHGPCSALLLWKAHLSETMHRHRLCHRLQLQRGLWRSLTMWGAFLQPNMPPRSLRLLQCACTLNLLLRQGTQGDPLQ